MRMNDTETRLRTYASAEQLVYASWLDVGMKVGFVALVASFAAYLFGLVTPHVAHDEVVRLWTLPVSEYLKATNTHTGWSWVYFIGKGDYLNFVGIAFLSGVTIACYARILPVLFAARDRVYAAIAVVEILVLGLAASGLLVVGH